MAEITVEECKGCGGYHLRINDHKILTAGSRGVCVRVARVLTEASNMRPREGIKYLCHEVGYEEEVSREVLNRINGRVSGQSLH